MSEEDKKNTGISMSDLQLITGSLSNVFQDKLEGLEKVMNVKFEAMEKQIIEGFKGVHERQDKTNGNVRRNRKDVDGNSKNINRIIGGLIITNILIVPLMFIIINHYFK